MLAFDIYSLFHIVSGIYNTCRPFHLGIVSGYFSSWFSYKYLCLLCDNSASNNFCLSYEMITPFPSTELLDASYPRTELMIPVSDVQLSYYVITTS